ncbi:MAG: chaperone protein HtpG [Planctomycetota bacterium]|nr:MAG: chaperone protein HtpG [Planctomycetota bacterium]
MTAQAETHRFQAETSELLDLMIHSLYSHKEIFLRELISNASDAIDKRRVAALSDEALRDNDWEPQIRLERDPEGRKLIIEDNGIGMSRQELVDNIGTIARSGTRAFLEQLRASKTATKKGKGKSEDVATESAPELIGQFGVGFYSAFMVAHEVELETRRLGETEATRWSSKGDGEFSVESFDKESVGTRITLLLRDADPESEHADFTDEYALRTIVKKYSDFVEHPVQMEVERTETKEGDEEPTTVTELQTLNSRKPLWVRPRNEIEQSDYDEFYSHLTHDWNKPLRTIHFRAEGTHEYTALLYLPTQRNAEILDPSKQASRLSLYVKKVFVMAECEELLPGWLRFVRGLVDSSDLPLNVSRETLQHNRQIAQIRKRLVKKLLDTFGEMLKKERETYAEFWTAFGSVLKEGLYIDDAHRAELAKVCLWQTSKGAEPCTLAEYVDRMEPDQEAIWYVTGADRHSVEKSPHLEAVSGKGHEVLFLVDPVDEWVVQRLNEFEGKPLRSLEQGDAAAETDEQKSEREEQEKELEGLLGAAQASLDDYVSKVRLSSRLKESPAVLVGAEGGLSPQLEAMLRASGQQVPANKRVLELNPSHPVVSRLKELHAADADSPRFHQFLELVHGQALLAEGSQLSDPSRFAKLVGELLAPGEGSPG